MQKDVEESAREAAWERGEVHARPPTWRETLELLEKKVEPEEVSLDAELWNEWLVGRRMSRECFRIIRERQDRESRERQER